MPKIEPPKVHCVAERREAHVPYTNTFPVRVEGEGVTCVCIERCADPGGRWCRNRKASA